MDQELQDLEIQLRKLCPARLQPRLRGRIELSISAYAAPSAGPTDPLATTLRSAAPIPLPAELANRLEDILNRIPHPDTRKVVHFPERQTRTNSRPAWRKLAAVAAVALLGSVSAFFVPQGNTPSRLAGTSTPPAASSPSGAVHSRTDSVVPAGFSTGLSEARDEGIIWQDSLGPQRMLKLVYRDNVTMRDSSGRIYQVERPRVKYVLVPEKID